MSQAGHDDAEQQWPRDELPDACRWLADAYGGEDPEQIVAALCAMYRLMEASGWTPSDRAATVLRVRGAAVDAALSGLVEGQDSTAPSARRADLPSASG